MIVYLEKLRNRLLGLLNGVKSHSTEWAGQAETPATIQANIDTVDKIQEEISTLEDQLSQKKKEARHIELQLGLVADTIENKAIGFHTANPDVLNDYDIKLRKPAVKKPVPGKVLIPELKDDVDGQGFIVSTQVDPDADKYEWEKGVAIDPQDLNTIPKMLHFRNTSKTIFVDDIVAPGVRYFYRVRAFNASGDGAWSAAVSRVQQFRSLKYITPFRSRAWEGVIKIFVL